MVGSGFQGNNDQVARANLFGGGVEACLVRGELEVTVDTGDADAIFTHVIEVRAQQEMHIPSRACQPGAVITTNGATANDGNAEVVWNVLKIHDGKSVKEYGEAALGANWKHLTETAMGRGPIEDESFAGINAGNSLLI